MNANQRKRRVVLSVALAGLLTMSGVAQARQILTFMGVAVIGADRAAMSAAAKNSGGTSKGSKKNASEILDVYGFPNGALPVGIKGVTFVYDLKERLISIECKVPMGNILDLKNKKEPNALLELLERKYGNAEKTIPTKGVFEVTNEYLWFFDSGGAISLKEEGSIKGMLLTYFDTNRERKSKQVKKDNAENAL